MNKIKRNLLLVTFTILIIGLSIINWNDLTFNNNKNAYVVICAAFISIVFILFFRDKINNNKRRSIIFYSVITLSIVYIFLEVILNLSSSNNLIRVLKIVPAISLFALGFMGLKQLKNKE